MVESTALRYFRMVADRGSIKKAAAALHIAPSAVGRQIQGIEDNLEAKLFERIPRGMKLTDAGRILYQYAVSCQDQFEVVRGKVSECDAQRRGHVVIATVEGLAVGFLSDFIQHISNEHPGISIEVIIVGSRDVSELVGRGDAHLGIIFGPAPRRDLIELLRIPRPICLIVATGHPLAKKSQCTMKELDGLHVTLPNSSFGIRQEVDRACARTNIQLDVRHETNSLGFSLALATQGTLATFLTRTSVKDAILAGKAVAIPIRDAGLESTFVTLVQLAGRNVSPAVSLITDELIPKMKLRKF